MRRVYEIDKLTGEVTRVFASAYAADRALGNDVTTIANVARSRSVSRGRYFYRYEDDYVPHEDIRGRYHRPVALFEDGKPVGSVCDAATLAERLNLARNTVANAVRRGSRLGGRFTVAYYDRVGVVPELDEEG